MMVTTEAVWSGFAEPLRAFIRRRVSDPDVADDVLQEVFVKVHAGLPRLQDGDRLQPWLYRIARNAVVDSYRARGGARVPLPESLVAEEDEPRTSAELAACIRPFVEQLPEPYREAVRLTELEGLPQTRLAAHLGISVSGAKSRVQRGRARLKQMITDCCEVRMDAAGLILEFVPRSVCGCVLSAQRPSVDRDPTRASHDEHAHGERAMLTIDAATTSTTPLGGCCDDEDCCGNGGSTCHADCC
ncbi:MAG TPA: RNA polymerase sigma factor SigZ [Longimicrobium sp.]|jgi:RNA polymerase sigma-70 factor (ECF subfamily)|uniref:RNA polymerase sigma factor SigZ n=1 Tax=Longimicrobium sp. TaxID=2029185 RepID=UPI002EDB6540